MITWRLLRDLEPKMALIEKLAAKRGTNVDEVIVDAVAEWLERQIDPEAERRALPVLQQAWNALDTVIRYQLPEGVHGIVDRARDAFAKEFPEATKK